MPEWVGGEETAGGGTAYAGDSVFDFDAHIARLMARAEGRLVDSHDLDDEGDDEEEDDDDEFDGEGDAEDDDGGEAAGGRGARLRAAGAPRGAPADAVAAHSTAALSSIDVRVSDDLLSAVLAQVSARPHWRRGALRYPEVYFTPLPSLAPTVRRRRDRRAGPRRPAPDSRRRWAAEPWACSSRWCWGR